MDSQFTEEYWEAAVTEIENLESMSVWKVVDLWIWHECHLVNMGFKVEALPRWFDQEV